LLVGAAFPDVPQPNSKRLVMRANILRMSPTSSPLFGYSTIAWVWDCSMPHKWLATD
jgi:hypothetical protein